MPTAKVTSRDRAPQRLAPRPPDVARLAFRRGRRFPLAIAWFGARSFWGHLWHLAASVIATEDIDSRDWMVADERGELTKRVADELGGDGDAGSLTEALESDLWIDFVADTGDDSSVSGAVARMLVDTYLAEDPEQPGVEMTLPRGHLLVFGGDTAYPVATELEIHNRVIVPFNKALRAARDGRPRVLLGVPGNHDWYAGLDGFGRMFRRRRGHVDRASPLKQDEIDVAGQVGHLVHWFEAFRVGHHILKRPTLPLEGYAPVQSASYFALRLAPRLDMWGPDRQLKTIDFHQRTFFGGCRDAGRQQGVVLVLADPVFAFLEPNAAGVKILDALDVDLERDGALVLTGDTHHYCRQERRAGLHVTAGGGGAFLHPARILRRGVAPPAAEFPGPRASLALALRVPVAIASGRSGFLAHVAIALMYAPAYGVDIAHGHASPAAAALTSCAAFAILLAIGGWRRDRVMRIAALAAVSAAAFGFLPFAFQLLVEARAWSDSALAPHAIGAGAFFLVAVFAGTLVFGGYLAALTIFGLEQHQAFAALAHPGYKHFVRLRVKRDGSRIDGFAIGKVDPLSKHDKAVLVDRFVWKNPAFSPRAR